MLIRLICMCHYAFAFPFQRERSHIFKVQYKRTCHFYLRHQVQNILHRMQALNRSLFLLILLNSSITESKMTTSGSFFTFFRPTYRRIENPRLTTIRRVPRIPRTPWKLFFKKQIEYYLQRKDKQWSKGTTQLLVANISQIIFDSESYCYYISSETSLSLNIIYHCDCV